MTLEERMAVDKFKDHLDDKDVEYDEDKYDTKTLVRFLRARKLDIEKAYTMFTEFLSWRETDDVDHICVSFIHFYFVIIGL